MRWLGLLPLLRLFLVFGRKRTFVTTAAMQRALDDGNARLVLAAVTPRALPETVEAFAGVAEEGVVVSEHLRAQAGVGEGELARLADAAAPKGLGRFLLPRVRVVCADAGECAAMRELGREPWPYDALIEEFALAK
jgi:hypothetical protein